jgi:hypothetical protein
LLAGGRAAHACDGHAVLHHHGERGREQSHSGQPGSRFRWCR